MRPRLCSQSSGPVVVGLRVLEVVELVRQHGAGGLARDAPGDLEVVVRVVRSDGRGGDDHLGAEGPQQLHLLLAHLVGHGEDAAIPARGRGHREGEAGIAAGGLDDDAPGSQGAIALRRLHQRKADPVLHRASGAHELALSVDRRATTADHPVQPHKGSPSHHVHDAVVRFAMANTHGRTTSRIQWSEEQAGGLTRGFAQAGISVPDLPAWRSAPGCAPIPARPGRPGDRD